MDNLHLKLLVDKASDDPDAAECWGCPSDIPRFDIVNIVYCWDGFQDVSTGSEPISGSTDAIILMTYCELYRRFLEELEINWVFIYVLDLQFCTWDALALWVHLRSKRRK